MSPRRFQLFPGLIIVLIGLNTGVVGLTVFLATSDPTVAVEPQYYQQAVAWNQTARQAAQSAALGWQAAVEAGEPSPAGVRAVEVQLRDREGAPVAGATVDLTAFASLRASRRTEARMVESAPGRYVGAVDVTAGGLWEFRLMARLGSDTFAATLSQDLALSPSQGRSP